MSKEYAEQKIREALRMSGGNLARARVQVVAWSKSDNVLLQALTRPHLDGIVSYQVERVASGRAEAEKRQPEQKVQPQKDDDFGMDLLRAVVATDVPVFGHENSATPVKRKGASKQHLDAINQMVTNRISRSDISNPTETS